MILASAPTAEKAPAAACMDFARNVPVSWEGARCVGGNGEIPITEPYPLAVF